MIGAIPLIQSTSQVITVGPFVDLTDGVTPETGLTLGAMTAAKIIKAGAGASVDISGATWAHISDGFYALTLDATMTNTLGRCTVYFSQPATFRGPVRQDIIILSSHVYGAMIAYNAVLGVDAIQMFSSQAAAEAMSLAALGIIRLTIQSGSTTTVINTNLTEGTNDHYNGRTLMFLTGALAGQSAPITDYNGSSKALTVEQITEAPTNGDVAVII